MTALRLNITGVLITELLLFSLTFTLAQKDTICQYNLEGKKHGYWISYWDNCDTCRYMEGNWENGHRIGLWTKYYDNGKIWARREYLNNRPNGYYESYYSNGNLKEKGTFYASKGNIHVDSLWRFYESGCLQSIMNHDDKGDRIGHIFYYYNNCDSSTIHGSLEFVGNTRVLKPGDTISISYFKNGDEKNVKIENKKTDLVLSEYPTFEVKIMGLCPDESELELISNKFSPSGYNKVYRTTEKLNLVLDGEFKNGCLWNGKHYIYDQDTGLLIRIENWKNGEFHSESNL